MHVLVILYNCTFIRMNDFCATLCQLGHVLGIELTLSNLFVWHFPHLVLRHQASDAVELSLQVLSSRWAGLWKRVASLVPRQGQILAYSELIKTPPAFICTPIQTFQEICKRHFCNSITLKGFKSIVVRFFLI